MQIAFRLPSNIYMGSNAILNLRDALQQSAKVRKAFVITDPDIRSLGYLKHLEDVFRAADIEIDVSTEVSSSMSQDTISSLVQSIARASPDLIVGIGDSYTMDTAKFCKYLYQLERPVAARILTEAAGVNVEGLLPSSFRKHVLLCAIATTASIGSEMTPCAFVPPIVAGKPWSPFIATEMTPDYVVVESLFTKDLSPEFTATAGLSVLSRAIDALVCPLVSDCSAAFACRAIQLVFTHLVQAVNGRRLESRVAIHTAAALTGMASVNSACGLTRAIGTALEETFEMIGKSLPQGVGGVIIAVQYLRMFVELHPDVSWFEELASVLRLAGQTSEELVSSLAMKIYDLQSALGLPSSIAMAGMSEVELEFHKQRIVQSALEIVDNCYSYSDKDVEGIISRSFSN